MDWFAGFLEKYPDLAIFLAIAFGYLIGGTKLGSFSFGPVTPAYPVSQVLLTVWGSLIVILMA